MTDPDLFDAVSDAAGDPWTRAGWRPTPGVTADEPDTFTAKPGRRWPPAAPPVTAPDELAAVAADASRRWAERVAAARALIDNPEPTTDQETP
jgi:hypothetical protein